MKFLNLIRRISALALKPVKDNAAFFAFMYILGIICTYATVPDKSGYHAYELAPQELFVDVYMLCVILTLIPKKIRLWIKRIIYTLSYAVAIVDLYCFVKFDTTITPTMLLLVGETDSREATEFLESYLSFDIVFSSMGWILLLILIHVA